MNRIRNLAYRIEIAGAMSLAAFTLLTVIIAYYVPASPGKTLGTLLILSILGALGQAYVELRLYFTMKHRSDRSDVGVGLKAKWWSLGWKNIFMGFRDALLFVLVVSDVSFPFPLVVGIVAAATASTVLAALVGNWLISRLQREEERLPAISLHRRDYGCS